MSGPWAECDRCKFRVRHMSCRIEWTGLFVCNDCYDTKPPFLEPPVVDAREGAPVPNARLEETDYTFADDEDPVTEDDL